jgi:hypothetical protein
MANIWRCFRNRIAAARSREVNSQKRRLRFSNSKLRAHFSVEVGFVFKRRLGAGD